MFHSSDVNNVLSRAVHKASWLGLATSLKVVRLYSTSYTSKMLLQTGVALHHLSAHDPNLEQARDVGFIDNWGRRSLFRQHPMSFIFLRAEGACLNAGTRVLASRPSCFIDGSRGTIWPFQYILQSHWRQGGMRRY